MSNETVTLPEVDIVSGAIYSLYIPTLCDITSKDCSERLDLLGVIMVI